jgi:benzoylformate decarboxylase
MRGADVVLEILESEGVSKIFGNPGTTELPLIDALTQHPSIEYVLALQEATAVAMADGYAQVTGRPAFVNLHTAGGLGHGMGGLLNAVASNTPLVITAGQQDRRHLVMDPLLAANLTGLAGPVAKWTHEVTSIADLPIVLRRAFQDAMAPPRGIVFLSLPMDIMDQIGVVDMGKISQIERTVTPPDVEELARLLLRYAPGRLALLSGDEVVAGNAVSETIALAEAMGAPVFGSSWPAVSSFPPAHPLWMGNLPTKASEISARFKNFDALFLLGGKSLITILYTEGSVLPEELELFQLSSNPQELGRTYSTRLGLTGDLALTLARLNGALRSSSPERQTKVANYIRQAGEDRHATLSASRARVLELFEQQPVAPIVAAHELLRALPPGTLIVDESLATTPHLRHFDQCEKAGEYRFFRGGGLGWAMPAAVGCSLGRNNQPTVCVLGDGAAMYSPQALWTAAHLQLPIVYVIMNNREYNVLKNFMRQQSHYISPKANCYTGMDLTKPAIDYVLLGRSMGVEGVRIERSADIYDAVHMALLSRKPALVEIRISS